jgi:hypothetical protein
VFISGGVILITEYACLEKKVLSDRDDRLRYAVYGHCPTLALVG